MQKNEAQLLQKKKSVKQKQASRKKGGGRAALKAALFPKSPEASPARGSSPSPRRAAEEDDEENSGEAVSLGGESCCCTSKILEWRPHATVVCEGCFLNNCNIMVPMQENKGNLFSLLSETLSPGRGPEKLEPVGVPPLNVSAAEHQCLALLACQGRVT